jgi:hypothetical protein
MRTNSEGHIIQLDGVRFIAVGLVLLDHLIVEINIIPFGALGVTIFFVLSGFLISRILLKSKEKNPGNARWLQEIPAQIPGSQNDTYFPGLLPDHRVAVHLDVPPVRDKLAWLALYGTNIYIGLAQNVDGFCGPFVVAGGGRAGVPCFSFPDILYFQKTNWCLCWA